MDDAREVSYLKERVRRNLKGHNDSCECDHHGSHRLPGCGGSVGHCRLQPVLLEKWQFQVIQNEVRQAGDGIHEHEQNSREAIELVIWHSIRKVKPQSLGTSQIATEESLCLVYASEVHPDFV